MKSFKLLLISLITLLTSCSNDGYLKNSSNTYFEKTTTSNFSNTNEDKILENYISQLESIDVFTLQQNTTTNIKISSESSIFSNKYVLKGKLLADISNKDDLYRYQEETGGSILDSTKFFSELKKENEGYILKLKYNDEEQNQELSNDDALNLLNEDFDLYDSLNIKNLDYSLFQNLTYEIESNQITLSYSKSENIEIFGDVVIDYEAIYDKYGNVISITSSGDISEINITGGQTYSGEISGQIKYTYNQKISHETRL